MRVGCHGEAGDGGNKKTRERVRAENEALAKRPRKPTLHNTRQRMDAAAWLITDWVYSVLASPLLTLLCSYLRNRYLTELFFVNTNSALS
jgi:hypothetical protein